MKKQKAISMALITVLLTGIFSGCAPTAVPPEGTAETAAPARQTPAQQAPAPQTEAAEAIVRGLTIAIQLEATTIMPARHTSMTAGHKNALTHNGLFRIHYDDLQPVPDLVESWSAVSDTLFEFVLREGVMFHNGEEVTAYDVVASFEYLRTYPYARAIHASVAEAYVVDRRTLRIDTGEPNALLFSDLAHQSNFVLPASLIAAGHDFTVDPIGSGPFVFEEWRFGDSLTFNRFDDYFDSERFPQLKYIVWRIIPEGASRTIALETGEVNYIVEVAFPDIPRMEENPGITVFQRPSVTHNFMLINNDLPQFSNIYVRHAIDMAIDKEAAVMASVDGWGIPIWETVPTVLPGASSEGIRSFDPDGARAILAAQGIDPATLGFEMLAFNEEGRRRGEVVQSNLADIGIPTTISMMDLAAFLSVTQTMDYEAAFSNFTSNNLPAFLRGLMHLDTIDGQNRSRIRNQELSDLIDKAIATVDVEARNAILEEASRVANVHAGLIPMHLGIMVRAFDSRLVVPEISASGMMYLNMVSWGE